jgi:thioredoxin-related protein
MSIRRWLLAGCIALCALPGARAQDVAPYAIDIPPWFAETFLDLREDVADAAKDHRRLLVYFGQDGCPYCRALMVTNFSQRRIVDKTRKHFVAIALNIWGDREVTWTDGRSMTEKALARMLAVQFTPTLLFFDENAKVVARLNGYYPPHQFEAVLDYVAQRREDTETLVAYLARAQSKAASAKLAAEPFFVKPPYDLARNAGSRPLAVLFETPYCSACDELHREGLQRPDVRALLGKFDVAQFALGARTMLTTPDGQPVRADAWARDLRVAYTPTIVFFDASGREVFRIDAYLRAFHLASALDYVASGAYRSEPSFQRFLQARAERKRTAGEKVELW